MERRADLMTKAIELTENWIEENPDHHQLSVAKENIKVYQGIVNYLENEYGKGWLDV